MIVPAVIAIAAIVALLVAFNSCSDPYDEGNGVVTPAVTRTTATPSATTPTASATTSPSPTTTASPSPRTTSTATATPSKTPTASPSPTVAPKVPVVVLNGTTTTGLAAAYAVQVRRAGWSVASTGNWRRTSVTTTTIYYPAGKQGSAKRLADDLSGAQLVRAALSGMSSTNLTIVVKR